MHYGMCTIWTKRAAKSCLIYEYKFATEFGEIQ